MCECVCARTHTLWTLVLSLSQIYQTLVHMCIETIYKALCNLPFLTIAGPDGGGGLLYHFLLYGVCNRGRDEQNGGKKENKL